jgi:hypothetical protein
MRWLAVQLLFIAYIVLRLLWEFVTHMERSPLVVMCCKWWCAAKIRPILGAQIDWSIDWFIIDWLIDWLLFYAPVKNFSRIWRRHHYLWMTAKFMPTLGAFLYRSTVPRFIRSTPLMASYDSQGDAEDLFLPGSSRAKTEGNERFLLLWPHRRLPTCDSHRFSLSSTKK